MAGPNAPGMQRGVRMIEVADKSAEYGGLVLAGMGADVLKVEAAGGAESRRIGALCGDVADAEVSGCNMTIE